MSPKRAPLLRVMKVARSLSLNPLSRERRAATVYTIHKEQANNATMKSPGSSVIALQMKNPQ